jgi:para-aminobenzoate synthetase component 1
VAAFLRSIPLTDWYDPADAFDRLYAGARHVFWLDAGPGAETGASYLGAASERSRMVSASLRAGTVTVTVPEDPRVPAATVKSDVLDFLRAELTDTDAAVRAEHSTEPGVGPGGGFQLGWVGWLGYEIGARLLGTAAHPSRYPDAALLEADRMLAFDHAARTVTLLARERPGETDEVDRWVASVVHRLAQGGGGPTGRTPVDEVGGRSRSAPRSAVRPAEATWRHDESSYRVLIERCQDAIRRGDAYQLCLTNEIRVDAAPDPVETYHALRNSSPSHHGGLLRFGDTALLSASPEQFLTIAPGGAITTKPIKGTRPRDGDAARDSLHRAELVASEKERAENLMIVDLMRNDLGRIAELGSVAVSDLLAVESYAQVHQLVSTVEAKLRPGVSAVDAVAACFPAGSMTGAPKISAMGILDGLEAGPRGIYSGVFGYFGLDGAADLAMVIRSIVLDPGGASIGTGGGITALSETGDEVEETRIKAAALLAVLGVSCETRQMTPRPV